MQAAARLSQHATLRPDVTKAQMERNSVIIRPSANLARKIKVAPTDTLPAADSPHHDWSARLLRVGSRQYILFTNTSTLYTAVIEGAGVTTPQSLLERAMHAVADLLACDGLGHVFEQRIAPGLGELRVSKALSRSVTGSLNDLQYTADYMLRRDDMSLAKVSRRLNELPKGSLDYGNSATAMAALSGDTLKPVSNARGALSTDTPGTPACGLCGKTTNVMRTDCCGNWICDDEHEYVIFSYASNSCHRNHRRQTLCGFHHTEGHPGRWQDCEDCRQSFEDEIYAYYGTNEYNFDKLENPPTYKPTHCVSCGRVISLSTDGYSITSDGYTCMQCSDMPLDEMPGWVGDFIDDADADADEDEDGEPLDEPVEINVAELLDSVTEAYADRYQEIVERTDAFCDTYLNNEYKQVCRIMAVMVCQQGSPARQGKPESWAAGMVHALGRINFLDDPSETPHMKWEDLARGMGTSPATMYAKSRLIREGLGLTDFDTTWTLPSRMLNNPLVWMLEVDGIAIDVRMAPRDIQAAAYEQGLIPFIPADYAEIVKDQTP